MGAARSRSLGHIHASVSRAAPPSYPRHPHSRHTRAIPTPSYPRLPRVSRREQHQRPASLPTRPCEPCVYILASQPHGAIYTGVTSDLPRRVWQHKRSEGSAFTRRWIKRWGKARRRGLIDRFNPEWRDLYGDLARAAGGGGGVGAAHVEIPAASAGMTDSSAWV